MPQIQLNSKIALGDIMTLPDIAASVPSNIPSAIDKVGMKNIELPLHLIISKKVTQVQSLIDAFVSLDSPEAKGIHMSRLYLEIQKQLTKSPLSTSCIFETLKIMKESQKGLSNSSFIDISFELPLNRPALLSNYSGYRYYPIQIRASHQPAKDQLFVKISLQYSSTCPCSAALSRQINQKQFLNDFKNETIHKEEILNWLGTQRSVAATPHSQRSIANIDLELDTTANLQSIIEVVDRVESGLKTAVQTAVKREDEQEFARLNAENLMFCEDAVKQIKTDLNRLPQILDFRVESQHLESLHAHDATAIISKGIQGGLKS